VCIIVEEEQSHIIVVEMDGRLVDVAMGGVEVAVGFSSLQCRLIRERRF